MNENKEQPDITEAEKYEGYTGFQPFKNKKHETELNLGQLFLGFILIFGGMIFLAKNMGWLNFTVTGDWVGYWPIFLIFAGLAMVKTRSLLTTILGIVATILTFGIVAWVIFGLGFCRFSQ